MDDPVCTAFSGISAARTFPTVLNVSGHVRKSQLKEMDQASPERYPGFVEGYAEASALASDHVTPQRGHANRVASALARPLLRTDR